MSVSHHQISFSKNNQRTFQFLESGQTTTQQSRVIIWPPHFYGATKLETMDGLFEVWWKWIREERGAKKNDLEKFGKNEYWTLFIQLNVPFCGKSTLSSDNTSRKVLLRDKQKYWLPRTDWKLTSKKRKSVESCIDWIKISLILFMRRGGWERGESLQTSNTICCQ